MSAIVTKQCNDGRFVSTDDLRVESLEINNSNVIGSNYLRQFYDCYENLDVRLLSDADIDILFEKVLKFETKIRDEINKRK